MPTRYRIDIDGSCGFCKKSAGWLKSLDWLDTIEIHPVDERGMTEMRVTRLKDGVTKGGFDGFRMLTPHVPLLCLSWPFLFIPGVPPIGRAVYRLIARNRHSLPGGCQSDVCAMPDAPPPAKKQSAYSPPP